MDHRERLDPPRVARGERLPKMQDELQINGHAIEVRVYAEDTLGGFTPDICTLDRYRVPSGRHIRVDDAFEEGMEIPIYYDPMIAKLVWGKTRQDAIRRCIEAIDDYQISGVKTTLDFGKYVLKHEAFISGNFDTNFVKHYFSDPRVVNTAMEEEHRALTFSIDQIWRDIKAFKEKECKIIPQSFFVIYVIRFTKNDKIFDENPIKGISGISERCIDMLKFMVPF